MTQSFPLQALTRPLSDDQREGVRRALRGLLEWQRDLALWPALGSLPDATPIVSLYAGGTMRGCAGLSEGAPAERVARSFVQALGDARFGGIDQAARDTLAAQVSYAVDFRKLDVAAAVQQIEVGTDGLALLHSSSHPALLLPDVARDHGLAPSAFLAALEKKAGVPRSSWHKDGLFAFQTERVVARLGAEPETPVDPLAAAATWLASMVDETEGIGFGIDPRRGRREALGPMLHGRAAVMVRALLAHGGARGKAVIAKRWLAAQIDQALAGKAVPGWPEERPMVLGTLALASLAGLDVHEPLLAMSREPEAQAAPWYAAQAAAALGRQTPQALWRVCARHLEIDGWAPWTAVAAAARGDSHVLERALRLLERAVRAPGPHSGGVGPEVPELARTAATVEALALVPTGSARQAIARAVAFLLRHQLSADRYPAAGSAEWAAGAFPLSPIRDFLQIDVTGHALLALVAAKTVSATRPLG